MINVRSLTKDIFTDKNGKRVIGQRPNLPLVVVLVASLVAKIIGEGVLGQVASFVAFGAIFIWALLEIFQGVNYFRRILGLVVLVIGVYTRIN